MDKKIDSERVIGGTLAAAKDWDGRQEQGGKLKERSPKMGKWFDLLKKMLYNLYLEDPKALQHFQVFFGDETCMV